MSVSITHLKWSIGWVMAINEFLTKSAFAPDDIKPSHLHVPTWLISWLLLLLSPLFWSITAITIAIYLQNMDVYLDALTKWFDSLCG